MPRMHLTVQLVLADRSRAVATPVATTGHQFTVALAPDSSNETAYRSGLVGDGSKR